MEAEEKLVERVARSIAEVQGRSLFNSKCTNEQLEAFGYLEAARSAIEASGLLPLLTAAEAFIKEAEEMGWGKTSDTQLPGSFDSLVAAVREVRG